jgi:transketolase
MTIATATDRNQLIPDEVTLQSWVPHLEVIGDTIDQMIDLMLNHRQSGHPGGSRSKVQVLLTTLLGGAMRFDLRHPEKRFGDRFILVAGHCCPLIYATLAVLNEALRVRHERTGETRFAHPLGREFTLLPEDLLDLRRHGGLPGHAEMEGKTLFFKFNTGPSGHGSPPSAGAAVALKMAGAGDVRVFALEGEGGMTAGAIHETKNTAYGLGLGNLCYIVDWNDHGIDPHQVSSVVKGSPEEWFGSYGFNIDGTLHGEDYSAIGSAYRRLFAAGDANSPNMLWVRTQKGRGYGVVDWASHGVPHKKNDPLFWETKRQFADKYGIEFEGQGDPAPDSAEAFREQTWTNINRALDVLRDQRPATLEFLSDRLIELGEAVPEEQSSLRMHPQADPAGDPRITQVDQLPDDLFLPAGTKAPNRKGFSTFAAYINTISHEVAGRPLFVACSADLANSTNISGFAKGHGDFDGFGWYHRTTNTGGSLLPQEITEFTNSGLAVGMACVNFSPRPMEEFRGFFGACSTYGSFSYLKYGLMRLFSQVSQDSQIKVGKVLWVAGHSGPETAEDSRTHFGIFAPGVTQLFPRGKILNLHPWEHNDVAPAMAAALATDVPIIALHLTRPGIEIPDREALGMESYKAAARGLYVAKHFDPQRPEEGTLICQGTSVVDSLVKILPELNSSGPNVRVLIASSYELFRLQPKEYQEKLLSWRQWQDTMVATSSSFKLVRDWIPNKVSEEYTLCSDHDDQWRTGGSLDEIVAEAQIDSESLRTGIQRFARERSQRLERIRDV